MKVEKDIFKEQISEKISELMQIQELSCLFKEKMDTLETDNIELKSKITNSNKDTSDKLYEEINFLKENLKEKENVISSMNHSVHYFNEKIQNLEKNNIYLERNCENLSRFEKYSEQLESENLDLKKLITVIFG